MSKIILKITYLCNHNCIFCHAIENKKYEFQNTLDKIFKKLLFIKKNYSDIDTIIFSGGEPTVHKDFLKILEFSSSLGFKNGIVTNGSFISNEEFYFKAKDFNLSYVYLSIHGGEERKHNEMTGTKNSFNQITKLLDFISGDEEIKLLVNCVITKNNIDELDILVDFLEKYNVKRLKLSLLEPKGLGLENLQDLYVSPKKVSEKIKERIDSSKNLQIFWDGLPICLMEGYIDYISNLQKEDIKYMSELFEDKIYKTDYGIREYTDVCKTCKQKNNCYGSYKLYNTLYGFEYLTPLI